MHQIKYNTLEVSGLKVSYRSVGNPKNPVLLLLHRNPFTAHQFRSILTQLLDEYYVLVPDYPMLGANNFSSIEVEDVYTFDRIAETMDTFLALNELGSYTIMI